MSDHIETWMVFEVLAKQEDAAVDSLEQHVEKIRDEEGVTVTSAEFEEVEEVENPHPSIDVGYSQIVEVEAEAEDFPTLIQIVMNFGPTMIEVKGPDELTMDLAETQESLNLVAEMMQKFLQSGAGGMMISRE